MKQEEVSIGSLNWLQIGCQTHLIFGEGDNIR